MKKLTTDEWIAKAIRVHGEKYDYSLVDYQGIDTKVNIICPIHGVFEQTPYNHYKGSCEKCSYVERTEKQTSNKNEYIKRANEIHGKKYDYSLMEYKLAGSKINIICPIHGIFEQNAQHHLQGHGCKNCSHEYYVGENHHSYKHGLTEEIQKKNSKLRSSTISTQWAKAIKRKSKNCDCCNDLFSDDVKPNAHHLNGWANFPEQRYDKNNGVALCLLCHKDFHKVYGSGGNTAEQYYEYKELRK